MSEEIPAKGLVRYQCQMDGIVWYEPLEQVLKGAPLHPDSPGESHYCPYCDEPVWPVDRPMVPENVYDVPIKFRLALLKRMSAEDSTNLVHYDVIVGEWEKHGPARDDENAG